MARVVAAVADSTDHAAGLWLPSSSGGVFFLCMMILVSLSVVSFVIFACGDSTGKKKGNTKNAGDLDQKKKKKTGDRKGTGTDGSGGYFGAVCGGAGCGGGGCGGGGCGGGGCGGN